MQRNFPDFIEKYLELTSGHEGTPRCHLWSIISVLAASLERKVWIDRGYYTLFPNLYVFIIGKSGLIKKSTTTGIAVDLFRSLPGAKMMSERLTAASLIDQLERSGTKYQVGDREYLQSAIFAYASELSVFMAEVQGTITELLTTFYDCTPHDCRKPWLYDTKTKGVQKIYGPCLNMLGASTQAWLKKCIPASEMEGGFSSRIIFVVEHRPPQKFIAWPELSSSNRDIREKLLDDLCVIHSLAGECKVTDKARKLFAAWYHEHMTNVVPKQHDARMSGYLGRKGDLLLKVAMVRSVSLRNDLVITDDDVYWAGENLEALEPDMQASFEGVGGSIAGEITFKIRNYIRERGNWIEMVEIKRAFAKDAVGYEIDRCLEDLQNMELIEKKREVGEGGVRLFFRTRGLRPPS